MYTIFTGAAPMDSRSIKEARQQFAKLVDSAVRGRTVAIRRHGKVVAQIGPASSAKRPRLPDLTAFRASLGKRARKSVATIRQLRDQERY
jgi:antitoxin (DNA-binding transcriptional repressor) of toxin-antitoxin stability system